MGFYAEYILPWGIELAMSKPLFSQYRQQLLADVSGEVLEIGFGTGLNLDHYPSDIKKLTIIDVNPAMNKFAQKRLKESKISAESKVMSGENLPMADNSFDSVVSTWTLCSIAKVNLAIEEIYRVLKPGGKFYFIEHGLSKDPQVQKLQNYLNPLQKIIGDGCNLNRNIQQLVEQKFKEIKLEQFYLEQLPKYVGYTYKGVAIKG